MYNPVYKHFEEWTCLRFGKWCKILNVCTSLSGLTQITNANFEWFLWILHSCHFKFSAWALRRKYCLFREQTQECCHKCKYCDVCTMYTKEGRGWGNSKSGATGFGQFAPFAESQVGPFGSFHLLQLLQMPFTGPTTETPCGSLTSKSAASSNFAQTLKLLSLILFFAGVW